MTTSRSTNRVPTRQLPRSVRIARLALGLVAAALLAWVGVTVASYVGAGLGGTTLVFSQEDAERWAGPAPVEGETGVGGGIPADEAVGAMQYVDVLPLALTLLGGLVAGAGAGLLPRRSRWSVPAGLAGMGVATVVGFFPALLGLSLMDIYRLGLADISGFLVAGVALAAAASVGSAVVWRHRRELEPVSG